MQFLIFLILVVVGALTVIYHRKIRETINFEIAWAEKYLGDGGTYTAYVLFGIIAIILGFMILFGIIPLEWIAPGYATEGL